MIIRAIEFFILFVSLLKILFATIYMYNLSSIINIDANNVRIVNVNFTGANDYSNNVRIRTRRISEIIISKDLVKI